MSSKSGEPAGRPRRRAWSITARLIALFTATTCALLLAVMTLLYRGLVRHLDEEHDHLLTEIVRVIERVPVVAGPGEAALVDEVAAIGKEEASSYSDPYGLRIIDAQGRVLAETPVMASVPLVVFAAVPPVAPAGRVKALHWTSPQGESYVLAALRVGNGSRAPAGWSVQVALDSTRDGVLLADLRRQATLLGVLGLVVAAAIGAVVARHGLRQVERIASEMTRITATDLRRRLGGEAWPRELAALVAAFDGMLDRLARAFADLSEFSANLAHEVRTPLNNLRGEAEVALLRARTVDEYREVLISSLEEFKRLARMVDGLLFLARADSHETAPAWQRISVGQEARSLADFFAPLADERGVALNVRGDAEVEADPDLFRRALSNLLSNALRCVDRGGSVTVEVAALPSNGAEVRVTDDGCGIAAADLPHVFERFYRASASRSHAGSGLGLAIVKSIMELHGGSVEITSEPGRGTGVVLRFPPRPAA